MSKITIPLVLIFVAIGLFAKAAFDRQRDRERSPQGAVRTASPEMRDTADPVAPAAPPFTLPARVTGEEFESLTDREIANIRLLPQPAGVAPVSFLWPTVEGEDAPAHPELMAYAQRRSFDHWKSFTDEHIAFFYPDAPGVRVVATNPGEAIPLLGEELLPADAGSFKSYRITAGDTGTLCVISLAHADGFDDAPRDPQPEVFHRFTAGGGGLLRTSFTSLGQVRRVEVLGDQLRASLLDWPHLAVHQDVYLRLAAGIELHRARADFQRLREAAIAKYGFEGRLGCLEHGLPASDVIALLGPPAAVDAAGGWLDYHQVRGGQATDYKVPVRGGLFVGFADGWREQQAIAPDAASIRWMLEKTSISTGEPGAVGYDLGSLTEAEGQAIFDRFVALGPRASTEDWTSLCELIANLAHHGLRDARVAAVATARLAGAAAGWRPALLALEACDSDESKAAIAEHIAAQLASGSPGEDELEQFYTLIRYLGRDYIRTPELVDRALKHQAETVRELGYLYCSWLPASYAIPHLEAGLRHRSTEVRRRCASAFASSLGDAEKHGALLLSCLAEERDEEVKRYLEEAIERLGITRPAAD